MIPALCASYYFTKNDFINNSDKNYIIGYSINNEINESNTDSNLIKMAGNRLSNNISQNTLEFMISFIFSIFRTSYDIVTYYFIPVLSTYSPWKVVLTCPLWFVLAHIHHCIEKIKNGQTVHQAVIGEFFENHFISYYF